MRDFLEVLYAGTNNCTDVVTAEPTPDGGLLVTLIDGSEWLVQAHCVLSARDEN